MNQAITSTFSQDALDFLRTYPKSNAHATVTQITPVTTTEEGGIII
jgi:hypothetical protein